MEVQPIKFTPVLQFNKPDAPMKMQPIKLLPVAILQDSCSYEDPAY